MSDNLVAFCLPDISKCGPAIGDIVPNFKEALAHFLAFKWFDFTETGSKDYAQNPCCICWYNLPLLVGVVCIPCCHQAVFLRTLEKQSGKSCESGCLSCCVLSMCCQFFCCYYAKKRTEFRKKYNLKGSEGIDCLGQICFAPCMLCQDANQLMIEGAYKVPYCSEGAKGNAVTPGK